MRAGLGAQGKTDLRHYICYCFERYALGAIFGRSDIDQGDTARNDRSFGALRGAQSSIRNHATDPVLQFQLDDRCLPSLIISTMARLTSTPMTLRPNSARQVAITAPT